MNVNLLRGRMAEKQVNQGMLAAEIGMSENSLSRKLSGKREFRLSEIVAICEKLDIENPKEIFFDSKIPNSQRNKVS